MSFALCTCLFGARYSEYPCSQVLKSALRPLKRSKLRGGRARMHLSPMASRSQLCVMSNIMPFQRMCQENEEQGIRKRNA